MPVALELRDQTLMDQFVSGDKGLCQIATLEGLAVLNPEDPGLPSEKHDDLQVQLQAARAEGEWLRR